MQVNETPLVTFPKSGALGPYLRVKLTAGVLALAGAEELEIGTTNERYLSSGLGQGTDVATVVTPKAPGTVKFIGSEAISQFAFVFGAASGKVSDTPNGNFIGIAMTATTADGDEVEVLRLHNGPWMPMAAQQALVAGGGAVNVTSYYTAGASDAGGDAWTLADGVRVGQLKKIQLITDGGGDAVLTPTNLAAGTTITFADAGDFALLIWNGIDWVAIELGNDADGATAPVLA
jgi:hypothetical protein